jgi:predicted PurR-regulated permease PerM
MNSENVVSWSSIIRFSLVLLIIAAVIWLGVIAIPLIEALLIAGLLGYLLNPVVVFLTRRTRIKRSWAAGLVYISLLAALTGVPAITGTVLFGQYRRYQADLIDAFNALLETFSRPIPFLGFQLDMELILSSLQQPTTEVVAALPGGSLDILSGVTTNLLWALVILVSLYYFLKDGPKIKPSILGLFPQDYRAEMARLVNDIDEIWSLFIRVQLFIFLVLAVLAMLGTGFVVWLFRAGLLPFSWLGLILLLIVVYTLIQQVDNLWLRPQLLGSRLALHPGLVLVALIGALGLSGILGAFLIIPGIATLKIIGIYVHRKILGQDPWPAVQKALPDGEVDSPQEPVSGTEPA